MKVNFLSCVVLACLVITCGSQPKTGQSERPPAPGNPANLGGRTASGRQGVVASAKPEASQVGIDILKAGGNAVDAAAAVGFAIGVVEPNASGIGGGGFMIIKLVDMPEAVVIDFRETAPAAATPDMFVDSAGEVIPQSSVIGGLASGVPGDVAGLLYALENYGSRKISRQQILDPSIKLAEEGYIVTQNLANIITDALGNINKYPATAAIYTDDGLPLEVNSLIKNPDLGASLRLIAREGKDAFYKGAMAQKTAKAVQDAGGIITVEDLANYKVEVRKPVTGTYRGYTIVSVPPASSGGTHVIQVLNILENMDMGKIASGSAGEVHAWTQALRLAFADRGKYMADSDFVPVPLEGLANKNYAKQLFAKFNPDKAMLSAEADDPTKFESGSTTSFSVMDKDGNMVTVTKSINSFFGSAVVVPGAGFIMNNHMNDFMVKPGHIQSVEKGKRPLSSMSPSLVLDPSGNPVMTLGSSGATRIIAAVAEVISNVIDHGMSLQDAIAAPRYFAMASGQVHLEGRIPEETVNGLKTLGYDVNIRSNWDPYFGGVQGVFFDRKAKILYGGADPRRDGEARGY